MTDVGNGTKWQLLHLLIDLLPMSQQPFCLPPNTEFRERFWQENCPYPVLSKGCALGFIVADRMV